MDLPGENVRVLSFVIRRFFFLFSLHNFVEFFVVWTQRKQRMWRRNKCEFWQKLFSPKKTNNFFLLSLFNSDLTHTVPMWGQKINSWAKKINKIGDSLYETMSSQKESFSSTELCFALKLPSSDNFSFPTKRLFPKWTQECKIRWCVPSTFSINLIWSFFYLEFNNVITGL